jgi:hypothetical protein
LDSTGVTVAASSCGFHQGLPDDGICGCSSPKAAVASNLTAETNGILGVLLANARRLGADSIESIEIVGLVESLGSVTALLVRQRAPY